MLIAILRYRCGHAVIDCFIQEVLHKCKKMYVYLKNINFSFFFKINLNLEKKLL